MMHLVITADFPVSDDPCYWNSALHFILFPVLGKNSTFSRIENNNEREDAGRQDKHKEDKKLQWALVR
jgi:hypothetical protein